MRVSTLRNVIWRFVRNPRRLKEAAVIARSGLFDAAYYCEGNPDVDIAGVHPLIHYVIWGAFEGRKPSALFDPAYYLSRYPDVARARAEPLSHFILHGASDRRNPGPHFDSRYYLEMNPDVRSSGVNPLVHFVRDGWRHHRNPSASFDCAAYLARYDDVRMTGVNPLVHYLESGRVAGRTTSAAADAPLPPLPPVRLSVTGRSEERHAADLPVVLCLTHVCPWPPHAGNAYRIYRMLTWLRQSGFRVVPVIVPLVGEMPNEAAIRKVEDLFSNVVVVDRGGEIRYSLSDVPDVLSPLDGEYTPRYSARLGEEHVLSGRERELLIIDRLYCPDAAIATVQRLQTALGPHVFLAQYVWMARVLPLIGGQAVKVLDTHDVFSTKRDKVLSFGIDDLSLSRGEEAKRLALADIVIAIQQDEHRLLRQLVPDSVVVTAGVDFDMAGTMHLPTGNRVLYIASGNAMNVHGLREFLSLAWSAVVEQVPDAELVVAGAVGRALPDDAPRVTRIGTVGDLGELYRGVRVVINPARAGTGAKIKTIEALSHLRPVVTFPAGVDGLPADLKALCDVVQEWDEFSGTVAGRLLDDRESAFSPSQRESIARATSPDLVYADFRSALIQRLPNGA